MAKNIKPAVDRAKVYMVLGLSIDDAVQLDDWDENNSNQYEKMFENLDEADREYLAQYIGEWMFDGDQWEEALRAGLHNLTKEKAKA